jgi:hypothetical protein
MNFRIVWILALVTTACRDPKVGDVITELRSSHHRQSVLAGNHRIEARILPPVLLALENASIDTNQALTPSLVDSLRKASSPNPGLSIVLSIAPSDTSIGRGLSNDVIYGKLSGFTDYHQASHEYQFGLKEKIWIEADGRKYPLMTYTMENSWGLIHGRSFFMVFQMPECIKLRESSEFELVLDDIVPGLSRRKIKWSFPIGEYDALI